MHAHNSFRMHDPNVFSWKVSADVITAIRIAHSRVSHVLSSKRRWPYRQCMQYMYVVDISHVHMADSNGVVIRMGQNRELRHYARAVPL